LRTCLDRREADAAIKEKVRYFKSRRTPMMWWTGPVSSPDNLGRLLLANNFNHAGEQPGMAVDLQTINRNLPRPRGLSIVTVENEADLKTWLNIVKKGFELPTAAAEALFEHFLNMGFDNLDTQRNYVGRLNNEPVASATLFLGAGVAGLYYVATLPQARQKGIAAAMTLAACLEARDMSYRVGVLQSSPMAVSIYRRLGFKQYCSLGRYVRW